MENEIGTIVKISQGKMDIAFNSGGQCQLCGVAEACLPANCFDDFRRDDFFLRGAAVSKEDEIT